MNKFVSFLFGYEESEKSFKSSHTLKTLGKTFVSLDVSGTTSRVSNKLHTSRPARAMQGIAKYLSYTSSKVFGSMLLTFGITVLITHLAAYYFSPEDLNYLPEIIIGTVISLLGLPLMLSNGAVSIVLQENPISDFILFDFLCIRRRHKINDEYKIPIPLSIIIGLLVGMLAFFVGCEIVVFVILGLLFLGLSLASPEFSLIVTLLILPYLSLTPYPALLLGMFVVITFISFMRKVSLGKRVLHFEQYDALIIIFDIFILLSGIFGNSSNSLLTSLLLIALSMGYILTSNLLTNLRLCDCAVNAIIVSSVPLAVYGIVQYVFGLVDDSYLDESFIGLIGGRVTSLFTNPNIYAVFLIVAIVFSFTACFGKKNFISRIFYILAAVLNLAAVVLTWTRGAWIALLFGFIALIILGFKKAPGILLAVCAVLPYSIFLIPESVLERFVSIFNTNDTSVSHRFSIYRASFEMLKDNIFTGVGIGTDAFKNTFLKYAEDGVSAPHSHNMFLEIACEAGIFALIAFILILLIRVRHIGAYRRYISRSSVANLATMSVITTLCLIIFGMTDYIFYDMRMFFMFFAVFGITSAALRISKQENDDRLSYFGDGRDADSSGIDVALR